MFVEVPIGTSAASEFAILEFTVNGEGGSKFEVASQGQLRVTVDVYDANGRVDEKQPQLGQQALLSLQIREVSTSKPVTQTNLTPRLEHELGGKPEKHGVHRLKAELNGIRPGEYTLAIVLMEKRATEGDSEMEMHYSLQDILSASLTVTNEGGG